MGNPNRQRGVGRSAGKGWKMEQRLRDGGFVSPKILAQKEGKGEEADDIGLDSKRPVDAGNLHAGLSIPKSVDKSSVSRPESVKKKRKNPYSPEDDLAHLVDDDGKILNAVAEVLDKASDEELVKLEKEIAGFSPTEQRFIDPMDDDYSNEFWKEKREMEKKGAKTTDQWVSAFRDSYITKRLGWGNERQLAPEKRAILETYLNLKLPIGIPEEKTKDVEGSAEKTKKTDPNNLTIKNKHMEKVLSDQAIINRREINRARGFAPKGMRNIAKVSTDGRAPDFPDVPLTPEERMNLAGAEQTPIVPGLKPDAEPVAPKPEDLAQAELNQAINDFEAKQSQIAEMRAKKMGRWTSLRKTLGLKIRNIDDDPEVMNLEKESHDKYRELLSKGIHLYKGKPQLEDFLQQFNKFEVFRSSYNQEMEKRAEFAKWPESVLAGFHKIGKRWGELKKWQQIAISLAGGSLVAGTALAVGAGAITGLVITSGYRWGFRGFVSAAAGIGRKTKLDKEMLEGMSQEKGKEVTNIMQILQQHENDIDTGIAMVLNRKMGNEVDELRNNYEKESAKNTKQALWLAGNTFLISSLIGESLRLGGQYTGINMGTILKKIGGYVGIGGTDLDIYRQGFSGGRGSKIIEEAAKLPAVGAAYEPPEDILYEAPRSGGRSEFFPEGETPKGVTGEGMDGAQEIEGKSAKDPFTNLEEPQKDADVSGPEKLSAHTPEEIEKARFEDIASVKIKAGGNMWASIESKIKADPSAYGLDQTDPNFKTNMNGKISGMLHDFADKNGLSYKQLDKVFEGDNFKIGHDAAGKPYLYDFQGKAFGADVSQASVPEEIAPSNSNMAVEDVKPRPGAGVVTDHQPARGGGKIAGMEQIEERQREAQKRYAETVRVEQELQAARPQIIAENARELALINDRLYLSTRGLINQLVNGAGVGDRADFWNQPMNSWSKLLGSEYQISQDVQFNDAVAQTNINLDKLRSLYPILEKYHRQGIESIGDCLKAATRNSMDLYEINQLVLRK